MESIARLYDLSGQVAIVTGAGRGIGFGIAVNSFGRAIHKFEEVKACPTRS